jgi:hypothetical protein
VASTELNRRMKLCFINRTSKGHTAGRSYFEIPPIKSGVASQDDGV